MTIYAIKSATPAILRMVKLQGRIITSQFLSRFNQHILLLSGQTEEGIMRDRQTPWKWCHVYVKASLKLDSVYHCNKVTTVK